MRYATAEAFRRAHEARLSAQARDTGRALTRLRKEVAFDRFLARLLRVAPGRWILKGGLALDYRFGDRARTTKDIDLVTAGDERGATADLLAAQAFDLGDFFVFSIERTARLDELQEGSAVRYHVRTELAGRVFDEFLVDVGFDFPRDTNTEVLRGPDHLSFADIAPVEAPALPLEAQLAEKVHALSRPYGGSGIASTRVKDPVDIHLTAASPTLSAERLRAAIDDTFGRRGRHDVPITLPRPPADWRIPYARMAKEVGVEPDIDVGFEVASRLLEPVLRNRTVTGAWNPATRQWRP